MSITSNNRPTIHTLWIGWLVMVFASISRMSQAQGARTLGDLLDEETGAVVAGNLAPREGAEPAESAASRRAIPSTAQSAAASKAVREIFGNDIAQATTPASKITLAKNLVAEATRTIKDTERWALLSESLRLAMDAGSIEETDRVVEKIADIFAVDVDRYRLDALTQMAAKAGPANADSIALACIKESRAAASRGRRDDAAKLLSVGQRLAQKNRNQSLTAQFQALAAEYRTAEKNERELAGLVERYRANPSDPLAALALAKHYCFVLDDWARGVPLLAKGSEADLAAIAREEAAAQEKPAALVSVADAWVSWASREKIAVKAAACNHASELYMQALAGLQGLERARVEKKLQELVATDSAPGQKAWLTDLPSARVTNIQFGAGTDGKYEGKPIWCGGQPCLNSIRAMPTHGMKPGSVVYAIPAGAKRVAGHSGVFVPDRFKDVRDLKPVKPQFFEIKVDGRTVWKSPPLAKVNEKVAFDVVVAGGRELELVTMSESGASAFSIWLSPAWLK